jgi:hypothetical protein
MARVLENWHQRKALKFEWADWFKEGYRAAAISARGDALQRVQEHLNRLLGTLFNPHAHSEQLHEFKELRYPNQQTRVYLSTRNAEGTKVFIATNKITYPKSSTGIGHLKITEFMVNRIFLGASIGYKQSPAMEFVGRRLPTAPRYAEGHLISLQHTGDQVVASVEAGKSYKLPESRPIPEEESLAVKLGRLARATVQSTDLHSSYAYRLYEDALHAVELGNLLASLDADSVLSGVTLLSDRKT